MNIVLIKTYLRRTYIDIIIPSYLILLSYFIYFSQATSIVMRCGCNGPFGIQIEGGFQLKKQQIQIENCHAKMITSYQRRSDQEKQKIKIKNKTKIQRKNSKSTEKKKKKEKKEKENRNINEKEQHIVSIEPTPTQAQRLTKSKGNPNSNR